MADTDTNIVAAAARALLDSTDGCTCIAAGEGVRP